MTRRAGKGGDGGFMDRHFPDARPLPRDQAADTGRARPSAARRLHRDAVLQPPAMHGPSHGADSLLTYARPGIQKQALRRLARGQLPVDATLDLHGLTMQQARDRLEGFLLDCLQQGIRHALVIHGRGARSPGRLPVLKGLVDQWLRGQSMVLAFHSALPRDGGAGAVYVLLRKAG